MIVLLINNDQNPISYLIPYSRLNRPCNLNTLVSTAVTTFSENLSVMKSSRYPVLPESFWQSHSGFHASALPGISAPLLSPENVADKFYRLPFFAFGCVKPHCQFEIADVYSRTAKDRKCRNDVIKWCEPITAASLNKYGEVLHGHLLRQSTTGRPETS